MKSPAFALPAACAGVALVAIVVSLALVRTADAQSPAPPLPPDSRGAAAPIFDHPRLAAIGPDVHASADEMSGGPKMLVASSGALAPRRAGIPDEDTVRDFIAANADLWALGPSTLPTLMVERDFTIDGVRNIWFTQEASGVPVFESRIKAAFDKNGSLIVLSGAPRAVSKGQPLLVRDPETSARDAMRAAGQPASNLGKKVANDIDGKPGARFEKGALRTEPTSKLVVFPTAGGPRLAWRASIAPSTTEDYDIVIDDDTGAVLYRQNRVLNAGPEGEVFVMPNPDPDNGATPVVVPFVGALPPPHDIWVPGTITAGNNALVGEDRTQTVPPCRLFGDPAVQLRVHGRLRTESEPADRPECGGHERVLLGQHRARLHIRARVCRGQREFPDRQFCARRRRRRRRDGARPERQWDEQRGFSGGGADGNGALIMLFLDVPPNQYSDTAFASDVILHEYAHGVQYGRSAGSMARNLRRLGKRGLTIWERRSPAIPPSANT